MNTRRALTACLLCVALLVPALALAIPGAGDFTSLDSPTGREMADLYNMLAKICFVIFVIVGSILFGAILKFRRKSEDEVPEQVHGNMKLELGLLFVAAAVQIFIGVQTIDTMWYVEKLPETEVTVEAIGYQWDWQFRYASNINPKAPDNPIGMDGLPAHKTLLVDDLVIPAYTNIRLDITSKDVIHSLFVPELGIKMDAVPGRFNYWWVNADGPVNQIMLPDTRVAQDEQKLGTTRSENPILLNTFNALSLVQPEQRSITTSGLESEVTYLSESRKNQIGDGKYAKYDAFEYRGMCTELCGKSHYDMYFRVVAMTPASYKQWLIDQNRGSDDEPDGKQLYESKCASCHGNEGKGIVGQFPPLAGGSERILNDTPEHKRYHIGVILNGLNGTKEPIVVNDVTYNGIMQPWFNVLNDDEIAAIVNYERTAWGNAGGEVDSKLVAEVRKSFGHPDYAAGGAAPIGEQDLMTEGAKIYEACVTCHGADGKLGKHRITKSPMVLGDIEGYVSMLVNGTQNKSAMGQSMTNREIAAIISYTRMSFDNTASAVQPTEVERIRKDVAGTPKQ